MVDKTLRNKAFSELSGKSHKMIVKSTDYFVNKQSKVSNGNKEWVSNGPSWKRIENFIKISLSLRWGLILKINLSLIDWSFRPI